MTMPPGCEECCKRSGWISLSGNIALAVMLMVIGFISGSKAVMGIALYSVKDALSSAVALIGMNVSGRPADSKHPYGHGKGEFLATFIITILISIGTFFVFVHSMKDVIMIIKGVPIHAPKFIAFWGTLISIAANYKLANYLECTGEKMNSPAILNSAKHNHSDAVSSVLVAASILGTKAGLYFLDPLVAVIEVLDLGRMIFIMFRDSMRGLMDVSPGKEFIEAVRKAVVIVPGVKGVKKVHARNLGRNVWVDLEIKVGKDMPLREGTKVMEDVRTILFRRFSNLADIQIHLEPYNPV
ncbi:MAG: cation diffusion facilitator family transporter [Nitrospirota bacterium]|nr:cation diffusion facilitator family transporter [Nitrospirota bacterium]